MINKITLEKLEELVKQKEAGLLTDDAYGYKASEILNEYIDLDARYDNRDKQMAYLCSTLSFTLSAVQALMDCNAEIYNLLNKGRKKDNLDTFTKSLKQHDKVNKRQQIEFTTDLKPKQSRINDIVAEAEKVLNIKFQAPIVKAEYTNEVDTDLVSEFREFMRNREEPPVKKGREKKE